MLALVLLAFAIVVVASVARWAVRSAPEPAINAEFKGLLSWAIVVVAVILLLIVLWKIANLLL